MSNTSLTVREVCLYSMLGAGMYGMKMLLAGLPNVELVSLMVMVLAVVSGWKGLWSVYLYVFLEFCTWGVHLWSLSYLYVWLILYAAAHALRSMDSALGWALLSALFGLCFGALCALPMLLTAGWQGALSWWIAGIPYDLLHGAANGCLAFFLFVPVRSLLTRLIADAAKGQR